eukprot:scaffold499_cov335-Pavlova_lutheri.AAC.8
MRMLLWGAGNVETKAQLWRWDRGSGFGRGRGKDAKEGKDDGRTGKRQADRLPFFPNVFEMAGSMARLGMKKEMLEMLERLEKLDALDDVYCPEEGSLMEEEVPSQGEPSEEEPSLAPSERALQKMHREVMLLDKALDPTLTASEREAEDEGDTSIGADADWKGGEEMEDIREADVKHHTAAPGRTGQSLLEYIGQAVELVQQLQKEQRKQKGFLGSWKPFMIHVANMVKQKKRAAKLCIPQQRYANILHGSEPLPTRDLRRVPGVDFLVKVPSQNKRHTPPRLVPSMQDWVRVLAQMDEESDHAGNSLGLYRAMQRQGFAVPGLQLCQVWIDLCPKCMSSAKQAARDDAQYKECTTKELIRRFCAGSSNPPPCPPP